MGTKRVIYLTPQRWWRTINILVNEYLHCTPFDLVFEGEYCEDDFKGKRRCRYVDQSQRFLHITCKDSYMYIIPGFVNGCGAWGIDYDKWISLDFKLKWNSSVWISSVAYFRRKKLSTKMKRDFVWTSKSEKVIFPKFNAIKKIHKLTMKPLLDCNQNVLGMWDL